MTGREIQAIRQHYGESVETFGARFAVSGRTVENWEQGHRSPSTLIQRLLEALQPKPAKKSARKTARR